MTSFHISVRHPSQLTPEATTTSYVEKVPDQITKLGLTKHTWDSLRNAIIAALRTPNVYNIGLEGHGLAWEAWLDEFLDGGVGDRFWPEKGMPLCWKEDKLVIREAVKTQVLSIAAEERRNIKVIQKPSNAAGRVLRTRSYEGKTNSTQGKNLNQARNSTASFSGDFASIRDKLDETKIHTRKTRAATKKLQAFEGPRKWGYTPTFREDSLEARATHEANQTTINTNASYHGDFNELDPPRLRRGPARTKKMTGWVAVNEVGQDTNYIHNEPTATKRSVSERPVATPRKRRCKIPTQEAPDSPTGPSSESVINPENHIPTPCLTPATPSVSAIAPASSSLVLETRLTTSPKMKFIYAADTPSLSHFLEKVRQKWMLSETQRVCSVEIEMGSKIFDVDLREERDWGVVLGIMESCGENIGVAIGVTE